MASIINASSSGSGGIVQTADASGVLQLQSNGSVAVQIDAGRNLYLNTTTAFDQISGTNFNINAPTGQANKIVFGVNNVSTGFIYNNSTEVAIGYPASGSLKFQLAGVGNVMVLDSVGRATTQYQPAFLAGSTDGDTSVTDGSPVPFNSTGTSGFNVGSGYSTSTYLFTAPIAGKYIFNFLGYFTNSAGSTQSMQIAPKVNGSYVTVGGDVIVMAQCTPNNVGGTMVIGGSVVLNLAANDTVGMYSRGSTARFYMGHTKFSGYLLG